MKTGSIAKFVTTDESGNTVRYVGRLAELTDTTVSLRTLEGTMEFSLTDGELKSGRGRDLPEGFDDELARRDAVAEAAPTTEASEEAPAAPKRTRTPRSESKKARAVAALDAYVESNGELPKRKDAISMLTDLGLTAAGASTYFANYKKARSA